MLEAINLTKSYGKFRALKGLNLKIQKGEVFCLLGQNGAGKTTTINIFLGLIPATNGKALINTIEIRPNSSDFNKLMGSQFLWQSMIFLMQSMWAKIGIMKEGELVHVAQTNGVDASELQELYLKTI